MSIHDHVLDEKPTFFYRGIMREIFLAESSAFNSGTRPRAKYLCVRGGGCVLQLDVGKASGSSKSFRQELDIVKLCSLRRWPRDGNSISERTTLVVQQAA